MSHKIFTVGLLRDLEKQVLAGDISYSRMVEILNEKANEHTNNRFIQGFACAVAALMQKEGGVSTQCRELFREGVGEYDLKQFRKRGLDEHDIEIFKKYREELI